MGTQRVCVTLAVVLCFAGAAAAQSPCGTGEPRTIRGVVIDEGGLRQPRRVVRLSGTTAPYLSETGGDGRFVMTGVCPGGYALEVVGDPLKGSLTVTTSDMDVPVVLREQAAQRAEATRRAQATQERMTILAVAIGLFTLGLLLFRHHNIVRTNRELLAAQVDNLSTRIPLESDPGRQVEAGQLADRAKAVKAEIAYIPDKNVANWWPWSSWSPKWWPWEWFFWSRGRELAGWMRLHEIERQVIAFLVPEQRVVERAVYAETELRELNKNSATTLADRMRQSIQEIVAFGSNDPAHTGGHALEHLKQQLSEGLAIIYDDRDTKFAGLMEWHNKAMFLAYLSLISIVILSAVFGHEELFLVGAVGGLMSRMTRTLFREDVPSDYGASWTTLFLSPLMGAIAAWIGIALIIWLREMNVLDEDLFRQIDWDLPTTAVMIAMAFVLGFSERLFTSLLSKVEGKVQEELAKPPRPPAPPAPLVVPPTAPASRAGNGGTAPAPTRVERIVQEIDLVQGERVAFVGVGTSPVRSALVPLVGAAAVFDATPTTLGEHAPLDGVVFETSLTVADVDEAAAQLADALRPEGRVVVLGSSPAALFDGDAATQRAQGNAGPAVVKESFVSAGGLAEQDPPEKIGGTDPVEWIASFIKPTPGGSDR